MSFREMFVETRGIPKGNYYVEIEVDTDHSGGMTYGLTKDLLYEFGEAHPKVKYGTKNTEDNNDNYYIYTKKKDDLALIWDFMGYRSDYFNPQKK